MLFFGPATTALHEIKDSDYVRFSLLALSSIFFLVDPFAAIGTFMAITAGEDKKSRSRTARRGAITCFIVLTSFALIGIDMLEAKRSPTQESSGETEEAAAKDDAGILPLGIPMLSGPGAISSVMVLVGQAAKVWEWVAILGSIAITAWASYGVLVGADRIRKVMGDTGIRILVRIMGLLLVALAVQFFVNGLTDLGVIARQ